MNKLVILIVILAIIAFVLPLTKGTKVTDQNQKKQPVLSIVKP